MESFDHKSPYSLDEIKKAQELVKAGSVGTLFFSEGTYQLEVIDPEYKSSCWPLLQIDDTGKILDGFCQCPPVEKTGRCAHLAAVYQKIFSGHPLPLHVRFQPSLWNLLGKFSAARLGIDARCLTPTSQGWQALSSTKKRLFFIESPDPAIRRFLRDTFFDRPPRYEESSLKFANLSPEELALWKQGQRSQQLLYELSFWSDLAKWWMQLQDSTSYLLSFSEEALPKWILARFPSLSFGIYISEAYWPEVIPSLRTVNSPLPVFDTLHPPFRSISYDAEQRAFFLEHSSMPSPAIELPNENQIPLGEWIFVPQKGFFPARTDPLLQAREIPSKKMETFLNHHAASIQPHLQNTTLQLLPVKPQYHLYFDAAYQLHIDSYLFEKGDLQQPGSAIFGEWVFLFKKGFFRLEDRLFDLPTQMIPLSRISEFISSHRIWLNHFEGFQTHISSIESSLSFEVSLEKGLTLSSHFTAQEEGEEWIDMGQWIYLKGKGFFSKRQESKRLDGNIPYEEINTFLSLHRQELEHIPGFFSSHCPLERSGLQVFLNTDSQIVIRPQFQFLPRYRADEVLLFQEYTYVSREGFAEIPYEKRLPAGYLRERVISAHEEPYFIAYELSTLQPYLLSLDKPLQRTDQFCLQIHQMRPAPKTRHKEWLLELSYISDIGSVDLYPIWQALQSHKKHLFTPAGLILLKQTRFNWLKNISKKRWQKGGKVLRLSTMDWLRLSVFDDLRITGASLETQQYIEQLSKLQVELPLDLQGFKSELRAYQEVGVKWLWFLYHHQLSALLCDEMGLGKTHQAMGLIAALHNTHPTSRSLILCPTSVIYHWEALLQKFLPHLRVFIFYGVQRNLEDFSEDHHLLLTSYGILRSEKTALSKISFDLAIFDEVQIAKNARSQTHKALKIIQANMRLGLTGTPIENRLLELKALFDAVIPSYLPSEAHFKELFVNPIERHQDPDKKQLLARLIRPFILRRKKSEVLLELPEKIEEIAYCDLSEEQSKLYREAYLMQKKTLLNELENRDEPVSYLHIFALLTTLKQICNHPCLITKEFQNFQKHASGKWDLFMTLLQQVRDSGQKLVVFSQYLDMLSLIERYLTEQHIGFCAIRGSTRDRKTQLDAFREDPTKEVFVASLQAVGVGVDLVSASVVIHYDRWWNPAKENQATDRVHRIGQNRGVQVFKLVTKNTIEEHIHQLIEKKQKLTEGVLSFDDQDQIKGFNRQELIELLKTIDREITKEEF